MSTKPQILGVTGVMEWFDMYATTPYLAVYTFLTPSKLDKCFQYTKGDMDEARTILENTLISMQNQDDQTLYVLKLYNSLNKRNSIDSSMEHDTSIRFRIVEIPSMNNQITGVDKSNYALQNAMAKMMETQNMILSKLSEQELEDEQPENPLGAIGNLINHPLIIAAASKLLGLGGVEQQPAAMAGIEDINENEAIIILNSLMSKGVTVDHLRKLDQMSYAKLSSLLAML
jgi:hypothetical protein